LAWQHGGIRMRSEARIALGAETGSDGRRIGRDPRKSGFRASRPPAEASPSMPRWVEIRALDPTAGLIEEKKVIGRHGPALGGDNT